MNIELTPREVNFLELAILDAMAAKENTKYPNYRSALQQLSNRLSEGIEQTKIEQTNQ